MRIGMMVDIYKPHVSGITNYIYLSKCALENEGHDVYIFTFGDPDYQDDETRVFRSRGLPLSDTGFYLSLRHKSSYKKLLQTMDIIHVHHPFISGRLALNYCRRSPIPVVFTNHTRYDLYARARLPFMPEKVSASLLRVYMPDFCEAVDLVISPSRGMEKVLRRYGVRSHIEIIPNGVDLRPFSQAQPLARADFGFTDQDVLLVYAGRIAPEKNLRFLMQSFAGISQALPGVHLLILGGGEKEYLKRTMRLPYQFGISNRVHFLGAIPYEKLPSYLAMCDMFVTASVTEVHPLSVIEGMAAGLPVMGIDSPGISDCVSDHETGLLATYNIASFTAKLTYLCLNQELRKKMSGQAYQVSKQYNIEHTTGILLQHYTNLVRNTKLSKGNRDQHLLAILKEFLK